MDKKKITNMEVKKKNRNDVFRYICKQGTVSNPEIAVRLNMSLPTATQITKELIEEGFVYEVISKIQTMRKEADFEVMDHIRVSVNGNGKLAAIAARNADSISGKVLAEELTSGADFAVAKEWNVNGEKTVIAIEKA